MMLDPAQLNLPPSLEHFLGTDAFGRDLFFLLLPATLTSLLIGVLAAFFQTFLGIAYGSLTVFLPKRPASTLLYFMNLLYAIPYLLLALLLYGIQRPGFISLLFALCMTGWVLIARLTRTELIRLQEKPFILCARSMGAKPFYLFFHHFLPNLKEALFTAAFLSIPHAIFTEAFLSFLGLSLPSPFITLGGLLNQGYKAIAYYPWRFFAPAGALTGILFFFQWMKEKTPPPLKNTLSIQKGPFLSVQNLTITHPEKAPLIKNFSLEIFPRETLAVVGANGTGKTSLAKVLCSLPIKAALSGTIQKNPTLKVRMVFQDPLKALNPIKTLRWQLFEELKRKKIPEKEIEERALFLLKHLGIKNPASFFARYPHTLSGGERQRFLIVIALMGKPDLLILDEPTASIDQASCKPILRFLQSQTTLILISHQRALLTQVADRFIYLQKSSVIQASYPPISPPQTAPLLEIQNLSYGPIKNLSFSLNKGGFQMITGANGSGKTTLAHLCMGYKPPSLGQIHLRTQNRQMVFQNPASSLNPQKTCLQHLKEAKSLSRRPLSFKKLTDDLSLPSSLFSLYPHQLSGGQQQKLALIRALTLRPDLLILDEPTASLDPGTKHRLIDLLLKLQEKQKIGILFITHDPDLFTLKGAESLYLPDTATP